METAWSTWYCRLQLRTLTPNYSRNGYAILTGATFGGLVIEGKDEITIVPPE